MHPPLTLNAWLRYGLIRRAIREMDGVSRVLEIGCGQGAIGARLERRFEYLGLEPDPTSFRTARRRIGSNGGTVLQLEEADLDSPRPFDLVCAFEVLEHLEDDRRALTAWCSRVRPDGYVLLSVPAHQRRYGAWDRRVGHFRRYGRSELESTLGDAGFRGVVIRSYGFPLGLWLEAARNVVAARHEARPPAEATAASGRLLQPGTWMGWLMGLAALPFRLIQRPFEASDLGTGFVVSARRSR